MNKFISIKGARQNNLKNINVDIPLNEFIVITGVSGSGKSSLAFDTIYAEGQRRYVETFSPYARQFLDRMDPPDVDSISGIPPAIAIRQANGVKTSRSTVGTMTEINDRLKILFAKAATLFCPICGKEITSFSPSSICNTILSKHNGEKAEICFLITIPDSFKEEEILSILEKQGYTRVEKKSDRTLLVIQDRVILKDSARTRIAESIEQAISTRDKVIIRYPSTKEEETFYTKRICCDTTYTEPTPNLFSFNSPVGACPTCKGFGKTIGISENLIIPDKTKSLAEGCIKPFQYPSFKECQEELMFFGKKSKIPLHTPWENLSLAHKTWVMQGSGMPEDWPPTSWYGVDAFFKWMESRSYKMHVRVMLSRFREYKECSVCHGTRLKPDALNYKIIHNDKAYTIHDLMLLPVSELLTLLKEFDLTSSLLEVHTLLEEIIPRLEFMCEAGLSYLTLDRQSRTLSGGELQRINLTTALGSSLVNTLFVLDEPSIGLHPIDVHRLVNVIKRLRDAGNTILVVEHDPDVIAAADRVITMGPLPGTKGGEIVSNIVQSVKHHSAYDLIKPEFSYTALAVAEYIHCHKLSQKQSHNKKSTKSISIINAREHNLKNVSVDIPLNKLVVVSGVSGSGKSSLINDVLYNGVKRLLGTATEYCGECDGFKGIENISDIVLIDQAPIGKSTRSTPASHVGAFDVIRRHFAALPDAIENGYGYSDFSFNSQSGRCPVCEGCGYEMVEMQFLSDVYLKCEECGGTRYKKEILEIKAQCKTCTPSIADVLEMTVYQAIEEFEDNEKIIKALSPLKECGLGYLKLGQPTPTLSGGEAQRLKIAGYIAEMNDKKKRNNSILFIMDEPTTGLHSSDVETLINVLHRLINDGHSVVVIEHNLQLIAEADWIIDMGPDGGPNGGSIVYSGSVYDLATKEENSLKNYSYNAISENNTEKYDVVKSNNCISIRNAREHNLKDISLDIPLEKFSVITGVSGSGKSTLAFDIIFALGQRRYLECMNAYARQFIQPQAKPDVQALEALPPTVAIEQRTSRGGWKSTVGTVAEINSALRVLFSSLGEQYCPHCNTKIEKQTPEQITSSIISSHKGERINILVRLVSSRKGIYKELAARMAKKGVEKLRVDGEWLPTKNWVTLDRYKEHTIDMCACSFDVKANSYKALLVEVNNALEQGGNVIHIATKDNQEYIVSTTRACPQCGASFEEPSPQLFSFNSKHGQCHACQGYGLCHTTSSPNKKKDERKEAKDFTDVLDEESIEENAKPCPVCNGARLNPQALSYRFRSMNIHQLSSLTIEDALEFFSSIKYSSREKPIAEPLIKDISSRLGFLCKVGLGYMTLDRAMPTLSGGEAQRIRLASQLGSNLSGVCYILDEPTIGLHDSDTEKLLHTIRKLCDKGNTVIVVEHDEQTMREADNIIDLGPGAGVEGGKLITQGSMKEILKSKTSKTAICLKNPLVHPINGKYRPCNKIPHISIKQASMHNLKNISVDIPIGRFTVVTGVSGSGKSTLVRDVLYASIKDITSGGKIQNIGCKSITGIESIKRVLEVDQTPIGRTPRSCPATYVGFWTDIRELFASSQDAAIRGFDASRFSFNIAGGRCAECEGQGVIKSEMAFLPDVVSECPICSGARFNEETLAIHYNGKSIADILRMNVSEALDFFDNHAKIKHSLQLLKDVGLGYLSLGQQSSTLSGGEAQRIKLVTELARCTPKPGIKQTSTLYILDEPTVGLHMADVANLIKVIHKLIDSGHTVIAIEHNHDIIAEADCLLEMGPGGGNKGGNIKILR